MLNALILMVVVATGTLLMWPKLANAKLWRAAITPLASIIGSGFLVLGPILNASFGAYAPLVMAILCGAAYLFGAAIRFNIWRLNNKGENRSPSERGLELASAWSLAFAYIISVAYYLNLLGAFAVSLTEVEGHIPAKLVTTATFAIILIVGWTRGFGALERLEEVSVGIKLAIIAGLLFGLAVFFGKTASAGDLVISAATVSGWQAVALVGGLLVTVQGFETSRYLGAEYSAPTRIKSMKLAQGVSTAIYLVYILLLSFAFAPDALDLSETAIIGLMEVVAPILPIVAALSAQFSAAVADTGGAGGLVSELTGGRLAPRAGYVLLAVVGVALTWTASVFEIISYASRAFALYYAIQTLIAAKGAALKGQPVKAVGFVALAGVAVAIVLFGASVE